ncbi:type 4a pilus biogenesis protein PilO [Ectothiorhodospiraceae bacterium 2226]|nr:type 4a pilus biogenesis protein PilO [Ectothiorhodospiraceae bacterium 2226]
MKNLDLNDIDFSQIGSWPLAGRLFVIALLGGAILFAGYWFHIKGQIEQYERVVQREQDLRRNFEQRAAQAANLDAYRAQMEVMEDSFGAMLRQLPSRTEVAELLVDISQTGLASGLEFRLFRPQQESPKEFYAELPIQMSVVGTYHEFGRFVSGIAALPRIVTLHNVSISGPGAQSGGKLTMDIVARTYRYLDEDEVAAQQRSQQPAARRRR